MMKNVSEKSKGYPANYVNTIIFDVLFKRSCGIPVSKWEEEAYLDICKSEVGKEQSDD